MNQNVWVYKNNGNDITLKTIDITKVREHVYYFTKVEHYATWDHTIFFLVLEHNGVYVSMGTIGERNLKEETTWERYMEMVRDAIKGERYFNQLDLLLLREVSERLWTSAQASRAIAIHRQEENARIRQQKEQEERERERIEKEERRKATDDMCASLKGILKDNLKPLQKALAASLLQEERCFYIDRKPIVCSYLDLILKHGFNSPDVYVQEYNRDGSFKAKPTREYSVARPNPGGNSSVHIRIPGRLGALMNIQNA